MKIGRAMEGFDVNRKMQPLNQLFRKKLKNKELKKMKEVNGLFVQTEEYQDQEVEVHALNLKNKPDTV